MASESERQRLSGELTQKVRSLLDQAVTARRSELGATLSFDGLGPEFDTAQRLAREFLETGSSLLPVRLLMKAHTGVDGFLGFLAEVRGFDPDILRSKNQDPFQQREMLVRAATERLDALVDALVPAISYARGTPGSDFLKNAEKAAKDVDGVLVQAQTVANDLTRLRDASKDVVQLSVVSAHAQVFESQATTHRKAGYAWLAAAIVLFALTVVFAAINYREAVTATAQLPMPLAVQIVVAKLFLFSLGLTAVLWCGRMLRAHRHNYVVNTHRRNSLASYEAFVSSSADPETKNAVRRQVAASIYAPQATGFGGSESDGASSPQIIEIMRTLAPDSEK